MKATIKIIKELDKNIANLEDLIKSQKHFIKIWKVGFTERYKLEAELKNLESKLKERQKQRLSKLETLLNDVQFEIGIANNALKLKSGDYVEFDGLILENTAGI